MGTKNSEKKSDFGGLEKIISPILVINQSRLRPYLELFENYPENISHQNLGILAGFFKINERSDDSAYIVNFLSSVVKKEYYANPKRPAAESFDAALHKVNLALAEIAKNGNVRWIGQLDAAILAIEKDLLHFTVCGAGKILLLRKDSLGDIGQDLNPEEMEPNPLKTFTNVSSGYLEKNDKLIATSPDLFNLFSLNELKKGSVRFDREKFSQFLKTALGNEADSAATIVIDICEAPASEESEGKKEKGSKTILNPFSQTAFAQPVIAPENLAPSDSEGNEAYTDERTGHIYVQGEHRQPEKTSFGGDLRMRVGDWTGDFFRFLRRKIARFGYNARRFTRTVLMTLGRGIVRVFQQLLERKKAEKPATESPVKTKTDDLPDPEELAEADLPQPEKEISSLSEKENSRPWFRFIVPNFARIGDVFGRLSLPQKIISLAIVLLIIAVPLVAYRFQRKPSPPPEAPAVAEINEPEPALSDRNVRQISISSEVSVNGASGIVALKGKIFSIGGERITLLGGSQEGYSFPPDFGSLSFTFPMEDLNLVFLLSSSGKLSAFSPVSGTFKENNLILPDNSDIQAAGAYLTYLYLADAKEKQIFRYPRATDGFGNKTAWLKDALDLSGLRDMAIEENIFLAFESDVQKFFRGTKVAFTLEKPDVPLAISKIYTGPKLSNLYALDSQNGRIIRYSKDGQLLDQYFAPEIKNATSFAVDEKSNKIYFLGPESLSSFGM